MWPRRVGISVSSVQRIWKAHGFWPLTSRPCKPRWPRPRPPPNAGALRIAALKAALDAEQARNRDLRRERDAKLEAGGPLYRAWRWLRARG
jgi:hypothetical protein